MLFLWTRNAVLQGDCRLSCFSGFSVLRLKDPRGNTSPETRQTAVFQTVQTTTYMQDIGGVQLLSLELSRISTEEHQRVERCSACLEFPQIYLLKVLTLTACSKVSELALFLPPNHP